MEKDKKKLTKRLTKNLSRTNE